jgi:hypothetical protein
MVAEGSLLTTRPLDSSTWDDFAALSEANNGVWGGCWCMGMHVGRWGADPTPEKNRAAKRDLVFRRAVHQVLVYDGAECVGWCQYGTPAEIITMNTKAYARELDRLPDWRIGCIFTGNHHRGHGVARTAVAGALDAIGASGGGLVEAYPEQQDDRAPQRGAYFHTGPESLFTGFGFTRVRKIAKWRWVMRLEIASNRGSDR